MAKFPARLPRSRLEKQRSREPSQPALSYEHIENFTKDLEVRRDLGNRVCPVNRDERRDEFWRSGWHRLALPAVFFTS